jgi:hypothetical protein
MDKLRIALDPLNPQCTSLHPRQGIGCLLPKNHPGPHCNGVSWERDGMGWESGPCSSVSPDGKYSCIRDIGHSGKHRNYGPEWD